MGKKAQMLRKETRRRIRSTPLTDEERDYLKKYACYEGSPLHKRNPGNFGLTPPAAPRPDKTLCDEAGIFSRRLANELFGKGIERGLVSEVTGYDRFPKYIWIVDEDGRVFEANYGGSHNGCYHGYPIRHSDPLFEQIGKAWNQCP